MEAIVSRRLGVVLVAAGVAVAVPAVAAAAADSIAGKGISGRGTQFRFKATEATARSHVTGSATLRNAAFRGDDADRSGRIVCANIQGDRVILGIKDRLRNGTYVYRIVYARDLGKPATPRRPGVDRLRGLKTLKKAPPEDCGVAFPTQATAGRLIRSGDITVTGHRVRTSR